MSYEIFHNTKCEHCNSDLTKTDSVMVHFSCGEHEFDKYSFVELDGQLCDVDSLVANGYHAGTRCVSCNEALEELTLDVPQSEEKEPMGPEKPQTLLLIAPFNLFPDGDETTKIVALGLCRYNSGGALAVIPIYQKTRERSQPISVNLPEATDLLDTDEFFLKDWSDGQHIAEAFLKSGVITVVNKPAVLSGFVQIKTAQLNRGVLRAPTSAEQDQYHP